MGEDFTQDTTTAAETVETDNSNVETTEPENDNSETVETNEPENTEQNADNNTQSKFNSFEEAVKGYSELEKKFGQQSNEIGELRKQAEKVAELQEKLNAIELAKAQEKGYNTVEEMQQSQEIIQFRADQYAKHLNDCNYPEEMIDMLAEYRRTGDEQLLNAIEKEFSLDTIKNVAGEVYKMQGQLEAQQAQAQQEQIINNVRQYLDINVPKYEQEFKNPAFATLYGEALKTLGTNLDTDKLVSIMHSYRDYILKEYGITQTLAKENSNATDEIVGVTSNGQNTPNGQEKDILSMSPAEIRKEIARFK